MIVPVASYEAEFGSFFRELPHDPNTDDVWCYVQLGNLIMNCHVAYDLEKVLKLNVSFDHYNERPNGDIHIQSMTVLSVTEKDGVYEFDDYSQDVVAQGVMPSYFFNDQEVLFPSMLRVAKLSHKQVNAVGEQMKALAAKPERAQANV